MLDQYFLALQNFKQPVRKSFLTFEFSEVSYQLVKHLLIFGQQYNAILLISIPALARFDEEPEDISVGVGQTARFSCAAQGIPPPTVTWLKDEFPLVLDGSRMTVLPSGSLEISQIVTLDEGVYKCNISNIDKHFVSRSGRLALNRSPERDTPPVFTAVPKNQIVIATHSVVLECSTVGYPQPTITWLKDGVTIDLGYVYLVYSVYL